MSFCGAGVQQSRWTPALFFSAYLIRKNLKTHTQ